MALNSDPVSISWTPAIPFPFVPLYL